jgi:type VI protein secretion system component Hcp
MAGFLKLEGIKGDAVAAGYHGWIAVHNVQFGGRSAGPTGTGAATGQGATAGQTELTLTASVGGHSPALFQAAAQGTTLDGELALTNAGGRYATVRLPRAIVAGYQTSGAGGDGLASESFALNTQAPYKWEPAPRVALPGRWLVTIGSWTGYFVFEAMGTVYWTESNGTGRHNGVWKATATDVQWRFAGAGDIRTFVIPVPITSDTIGGRILPAGQGFFTMKRE